MLLLSTQVASAGNVPRFSEGIAAMGAETASSFATDVAKDSSNAISAWTESGKGMVMANVRPYAWYWTSPQIVADYEEGVEVRDVSVAAGEDGRFAISWWSVEQESGDTVYRLNLKLYELDDDGYTLKAIGDRRELDKVAFSETNSSGSTGSEVSSNMSTGSGEITDASQAAYVQWLGSKSDAARKIYTFMTADLSGQKDQQISSDSEFQQYLYGSESRRKAFDSADTNTQYVTYLSWLANEDEYAGRMLNFFKSADRNSLIKNDPEYQLYLAQEEQAENSAKIAAEQQEQQAKADEAQEDNENTAPHYTNGDATPAKLGIDREGRTSIAWRTSVLKKDPQDPTDWDVENTKSLRDAVRVASVAVNGKEIYNKVLAKNTGVFRKFFTDSKAVLGSQFSVDIGEDGRVVVGYVVNYYGNKYERPENCKLADDYKGTGTRSPLEHSNLVVSTVYPEGTVDKWVVDKCVKGGSISPIDPVVSTYGSGAAVAWVEENVNSPGLGQKKNFKLYKDGVPEGIYLLTNSGGKTSKKVFETDHSYTDETGFMDSYQTWNRDFAQGIHLDTNSSGKIAIGWTKVHERYHALGAVPYYDIYDNSVKVHVGRGGSWSERKSPQASLSGEWQVASSEEEDSSEETETVSETRSGLDQRLSDLRVDDDGNVAVVWEGNTVNPYDEDHRRATATVTPSDSFGTPSTVKYAGADAQKGSYYAAGSVLNSGGGWEETVKLFDYPDTTLQQLSPTVSRQSDSNSSVVAYQGGYVSLFDGDSPVVQPVPYEGVYPVTKDGSRVLTIPGVQVTYKIGLGDFEEVTSASVDFGDASEPENATGGEIAPSMIGAASHTYERPGIYRVTFQATDKYGRESRKTVRVQVLALQPTESVEETLQEIQTQKTSLEIPGPPSWWFENSVAAPLAPTASTVVYDIADTTAPKLWDLSLSRKKLTTRSVKQAKIRVGLSEKASISFRVVKLGKKRKTVGKFESKDLPLDQSKIKFDSALAKKLKSPGRYRLEAQAKDAGGNKSTKKKVTFKVLKGKPSLLQVG